MYFGACVPAEPPIHTVEEALKEFEEARELVAMNEELDTLCVPDGLRLVWYVNRDHASGDL